MSVYSSLHAHILLTNALIEGEYNMKLLDTLSLSLVIVGALNWLLVGLFRFDLVAFLFGDMSLLSRAVYIVVGICGLYALTFFSRLGNAREG